MEAGLKILISSLSTAVKGLTILVELLVRLISEGINMSKTGKQYTSKNKASTPAPPAKNKYQTETSKTLKRNAKKKS